MKRGPGLKQAQIQVSLPARERGLKRRDRRQLVATANVAPRAGAWIETKRIDAVIKLPESLPARERGLKRGNK